MNRLRIESDVALRPACSGDGQLLFNVTEQSIRELAKGHYKAEQLASWMEGRTAEYYEDIIKKGLVVVAEMNGDVVGFVDSGPGEITRLFLLSRVTGYGLGKRLLKIGIENATKGSSGPIKVESTLNAQAFYAHHGFKTIGKGYSSHSTGNVPIKVIQMVKEASSETRQQKHIRE